MLNKPCRSCGKPGLAECNDCKAIRVERWKAKQATATKRATANGSRPNRQARGYDAQYDRNRKIVIDTAIREHQCCVICHSPFEQASDITAEHLIPRRDGGTSELTNLGPAHSWCNYNYRKPKATFVIR
jgi:hypothetical protein